MAIARQRRYVSYSLTQPLADIPPQTISASRDPGTGDLAQIGTLWVRSSSGAAWVLAGISSGSATWTPMTVNAGATIATGNLTVTTGNIVVTAGDITATAGDITATAGDITATTGAIEAGTTVTAGTALSATTGDITADAGDIVATLGDLISSAGAVDAATTVTAGTGITATTGNITATLGDVVVTDGDITITDGVLTVSDVAGGNGTIAADGDITSLEDVNARTLFATGDEGTGSVGDVGFTNVVDETLSSGAGVVLMKTANPGNSSGWLKIYVGTDIRYIPYWTNISP